MHRRPRLIPGNVPGANPGPAANSFEATSAYADTSNTFDPGGRLGQLAFRVNW